MNQGNGKMNQSRDEELRQEARVALKDSVDAVKTVFEEIRNNRSRLESLRPRVLSLLKAYDIQRQAWIAGAADQKMAEMETLEEVTKEITCSIVEGLDLRTNANEAVFWTGHDKKNIRNQDTAMAYSKWGEKNKKTLEMTLDGGLMDGLRLYDADSDILDQDQDGSRIQGKSSLGNALFDGVSKLFASQARGQVTAFVYKPQNSAQEEALKNSTYFRIEKPVLLANQNDGLVTLQEIEVDPNSTIPLWKIIDDLSEEKAKLISTVRETKSYESLPYGMNGKTNTFFRADASSALSRAVLAGIFSGNSEMVDYANKQY